MESIALKTKSQQRNNSNLMDRWIAPKDKIQQERLESLRLPSQIKPRKRLIEEK